MTRTLDDGERRIWRWITLLDHGRGRRKLSDAPLLSNGRIPACLA